MSLYQLMPNQVCTIQSIPHLALLESLGIRKGKQVTLKYKHPLGGPVILRVDTRDVAIGRNVAKMIEVQEG